LVDGSPKLTSDAADADEDFVDIEDIPKSRMTAPQSLSASWAELLTPGANRFLTDGSPTFSEQVFDVSSAQVGTEVQPNGVLDNFRRESVTFVHRMTWCHPTFVGHAGLTCQNRLLLLHSRCGSRPLPYSAACHTIDIFELQNGYAC